jgi:hypothetical protein
MDDKLPIKSLNLILDVDKVMTYTTYEIVEGDTGVHIVYFSVQKLGKALDLTDLTATITFQKGDKNIVVGEAVQITDAVNGKMQYEFGTEEAAYPGIVYASVELYHGLNRITINRFNYRVRRQLNSDTAVKSSTQYPLLTEALVKINDATLAAGIASKNANAAGISANEAAISARNIVDTINQKIALGELTGNKGDPGSSAYQLWLEQGNVGTLNDFYRNALRIFVVEEGQLPANPQEGDIVFEVIRPVIPVTDFLFRIDASTLKLTDGAKIPTWEDLSVKDYHLTQSDLTKQPKFMLTGLNNKPTVDFYAGADLGDGNSYNWLYNTSFALDRTNGATIFMVLKLEDLMRSVQCLLSIYTAGDTIGKFALYYASTKVIRLCINGGALCETPVDDKPFLFTATWNMSQMNLWINGIRIKTIGYGGSLLGVHNTLSIGGRAGNDLLDGKISEVVYFSRNLSGTEIDAIDNYLLDKWGLV